MKVLVVVEDEPDLRMLVRVAFALDHRFEVDGEASTTAAAVTLARDHQPHLIVLDNQLGEETTGMQAAPLLKAAAPGAVVIPQRERGASGPGKGQPEHRRVSAQDRRRSPRRVGAGAPRPLRRCRAPGTGPLSTCSLDGAVAAAVAIDELIVGGGLDVARIDNYYVRGPKVFGYMFEGVAPKQ